jgi:hypothetical protein
LRSLKSRKSRFMPCTLQLLSLENQRPEFAQAWGTMYEFVHLDLGSDSGLCASILSFGESRPRV